MAWVLLPVLQEYLSSGEFTRQGKIKASIINNAIVYGLLALLGLGFLVYLIFAGKFNQIHLIIPTLTNLFGVLMIVCLLGHGVVTLPKSFYRFISLEKTRNYYYFKLQDCEDQMMQYQYELEDLLRLLCLLILKNKEGNFNSVYDGYFNTILSYIDVDIYQKMTKNVTLKDSNSKQLLKDFGDINQKKLTTFHTQVKTKFQEYMRLTNKFEQISWNGILIEDIIEAKQCHRTYLTALNNEIRPIKPGLFNLIHNYLFNLFYLHLRNITYTTIFVITCLLSFLLILGEFAIVFKNIPIMDTFNIFGIIIHQAADNYILVQILILLPLSYITYCAYNGLFSIQLSGVFGFYKNHHTDGPSLFFLSINLLRVTVPLCQNFIQMVSIQHTTFQQYFSSTDLLGQFEILRLLIPIIILIMSLLNILDVYNKILSYFGLKQFNFSEDFRDESIGQGQQLMASQRKKFALNDKNEKKNLNPKSQKEYINQSESTDVEKKKEQIKDPFMNQQLDNFLSL